MTHNDTRAFDALARPGDQRARRLDDQCVVIVTATYTITPEAAHKAAVYHAGIPDNEVMATAARHSINNALIDPDLYNVLVDSVEVSVTPAPAAQMLGMRLEALEIAEFGGDADDVSVYDAICETITSEQATAIRDFHVAHHGNVEFHVGEEVMDNDAIQDMVETVAESVTEGIDWATVTVDDIATAPGP